MQTLWSWLGDFRVHFVLMTLYFVWYLYRRDNWNP